MIESYLQGQKKFGDIKTIQWSLERLFFLYFFESNAEFLSFSFSLEKEIIPSIPSKWNGHYCLYC